jgi:hypothetical protein
MNEKLPSLPPPVLDFAPPSTGDIPKILEKLIAAAPGPLHAQLREALKKAAILNPDDPVFDLVLVLELMSVYYRRIADQVTKAGAAIETNNKAALASLDDRVRKLQGIAQIIEQATDKLEVIDQEIVENFPVGWIVEEVVKKTDARIKTLPLERFEAKTAKAQAVIDGLSQSVNASAAALTKASTEIEKAAAKIEEAKLPGMSIGWIAFWMGLGGVMACAGMLGFITWFAPDALRVSWWLKYDHGKLHLVVPGHEYSDVTRDPETKAVTFEMKP